MGSLKHAKISGPAALSIVNSGGASVDEASTTNVGLVVVNFNYDYDDIADAWNRTRANTGVVVITSQALASGVNNSAGYETYNARGIRLFQNVTAVSGTSPTLDTKVQVWDHAVQTYRDLANATFAQATGVSNAMLTIYPGITASANLAVNMPIGQFYRVVCTVGGSSTPTVTASIASVHMV